MPKMVIGLTSLTTDLYPAVADPVRFNNLDDFSKSEAKIPLDFEPGEIILMELIINSGRLIKF